MENGKWADYVISAVQYGSHHKIINVKQHVDDGKTISRGEVVTRETVITNIIKGKSYLTVISGLSNWKKGERIRTFMNDSDYYIRIDDNKVSSDNLGSLPEI